jgi:GT2 family glycosyltransferase
MAGRRSRTDPGCVVLAYGPGPLYRRVVGSLLEEGAPASRIVVVHNPADPSEPPLASPPRGVTVLRMAENAGYAGGMNHGIAHHLAAGASRVLLLTHDVVFHPGALARLLEVADAMPAYGILGPALSWEGRPFSFGGLRGADGSVALRERPPEGSTAPVLDADWVEGSAVLVAAPIFEAIGFLDELFFMYYEETEFCLRASRAGWKIGVVPGAVAEQQPGFDRRPASYGYLMARNGLEYSRRAAGTEGLLRAFGRQLGESWHLLKVWKGRQSNREQRRRARARLIGLWSGIAAYAGRRWGPPPVSVLRLDGSSARPVTEL